MCAQSLTQGIPAKIRCGEGGRAADETVGFGFMHRSERHCPSTRRAALTKYGVVTMAQTYQGATHRASLLPSHNKAMKYCTDSARALLPTPRLSTNKLSSGTHLRPRSLGAEAIVQAAPCDEVALQDQGIAAGTASLWPYASRRPEDSHRPELAASERVRAELDEALAGTGHSWDPVKTINRPGVERSPWC